VIAYRGMLDVSRELVAHLAAYLAAYLAALLRAERRTRGTRRRARALTCLRAGVVRPGLVRQAG